jgi:methylated-DNA-[protein]-cysteine S-methyltransferase
MSEGRTVFETPLGRCALRWREDRLVGLALCVAEPATSVAMPSFVERAAEAVAGYLGGAPVALDGWCVDFSDAGAFQRRVWEALRRVPRGTTVTYGGLAALAGVPGAARAVGSAMARNPLPLFVPCHRVVPASGGLGAYSGGRGPETKAWLLALERTG